MEDIISELREINVLLNQKFGAESYSLRCKLFDIREKLLKDYGEKF